ncbi:MAG: hypothetical protein WC146_02675 [Patescibacteria group bacterium]
MDRRDSNRLEARRELRRKPRRANERRTNVRGTFGRQPWTSELFAIRRKASAEIPASPQ